MPTITGNNLKNHLAGTSYADLILGYGDDDTMGGGSGTDSLWGGDGNDYADGGAWDDRVYGETGNDTLLGAGGNDYLNGGADNDSLSGGDGNDTMDGGAGIDTMIGGIGNDVYVLDHWQDAAVEAAGSGIDEIQFGNLHVKYDYLNYGTAMSQVDLAGTNIENMTYTAGGSFWGSGSEVANVIRSNGYASIWAFGGHDKVITTGIAWVDAGDGNDTVQAGDYNDRAAGGTGQDVLLMGGGDDYAAGDNGNDSIDGGAGDDTLVGGSGTDTLTGGTGEDLLTSRGTMTMTWTYDYWGWGWTPTASVTFDEEAFASGNDGFADYLFGGAGSDTLVGHNGDVLTGGDDGDLYYITASSPATIVETADGTGKDWLVVRNATAWILGENLEALYVKNDSVTGGAVLTGNAGDNHLLGTGYADVLQDGLGNDSLDGAYGNDTARGGDGNDTVKGDLGNDSLEGGNGDDLLIGGIGTDQLRGGAGADIFRFETGDSVTNTLKRDVVLDFARGEDKVDLSLIKDWAHGGQGLHLADGAEAYGVWQGVSSPKSTGGIIAEAPGTRLMLDVNGDAVADMVVTIQFGDGLAAGKLAASDFIL